MGVVEFPGVMGRPPDFALLHTIYATLQDEFIDAHLLLTSNHEQVLVELGPISPGRYSQTAIDARRLIDSHPLLSRYKSSIYSERHGRWLALGISKQLGAPPLVCNPAIPQNNTANKKKR